MAGTLTGVLAPIPTPMTDDGSVAYDQIADIVDYTVSGGCDALVAAGTGVQETAALTLEERERILTETLSAASDNIPVVAGASHPSTAVATDLVTHAVDEGADAVIVMPPWGSTPTQNDLVEYFDAVAAESPVPFIAYNSPGITSMMTKETLRRVARLDSVTHVKETSRDWNKISWLLERVHHEGHASVLSTMDVLLATLQAGGSGAVVPPPASGVAKRVADAYTCGDLDSAIKDQRTFGTFPPDEASELGLAAVVKLAMKQEGIAVGTPRYHHGAYSDAVVDAVDQWLNTVVHQS